LARVTGSRQVIFSSHSEVLIEDRGVDPSEVLLLQPGSDGTTVTLASDIPEVADIAAADGNIAPIVTGLTRPKDSEQLSLYGR
jgi:hypothetical protein